MKTYPGFGAEPLPLFTIGTSADDLAYAAGSGLDIAEVNYHHNRNEALAKLRTALAQENPENFSASLVARAYPLVVERIAWEEDVPGTSEVAHVPFPQEAGGQPDDLVGVAKRSLTDGSVRVFSYAEWSAVSDDHDVPGTPVQPSYLRGVVMLASAP